MSAHPVKPTQLVRLQVDVRVQRMRWRGSVGVNTADTHMQRLSGAARQLTQAPLFRADDAWFRWVIENLFLLDFI
jgi:hypothetical protein